MSDIAVNFVAYQKQIVFFRQGGNLFQNFFRVDHTRRVVGIYYQDSEMAGLYFYFIFQIFLNPAASFFSGNKLWVM